MRLRVDRFLLLLIGLFALVGGAAAALGWRAVLGVVVGYFLAVLVVLLEDGRASADEEIPPTP